MNIRTLKAEEIEARVASQNANGSGCSLLLYKDARCDMRMLDEVFGSMNWTRSHELIDGNLFCNVSVWDDSKQQWITKQDVGKESYADKEKGRASDAFKRACFNFGIGRELYTAPFIWINLNQSDMNQNGKVKTNFLVKEIGHNENREINHLVIADERGVERFRYENGKGSSIKAKENKPDEYYMVIQEIKGAASTEELTRIYNNNQSLHADKDFISALSARKKVIA